MFKIWQLLVMQIIMSVSLGLAATYFDTLPKTDPFPYFFSVLQFGISLLLGGVLLLINKNASVSQLKKIILSSAVALGHLLFVGLALFIFDGTLKSNFFYTHLCASLTLILLANVINEQRPALMVLVVLAALGFVSRLDAIYGMIFFAALLSSGFAGMMTLFNDDAAKNYWLRLNLAIVSFVLARAALQLYLQVSGYDNLGVVITHSYTFVALALGFVAPWLIDRMCEDAKHPDAKQPAAKLHAVEAIVIAALIIPTLLGFYIHIRPVGAYMMGLSLSALIYLLLQNRGAKTIAVISVLSAWSLYFNYPFFRDYGDFTRKERIVGIIILAVLSSVYLLVRKLTFSVKLKHAA